MQNFYVVYNEHKDTNVFVTTKRNSRISVCFAMFIFQIYMHFYVVRLNKGKEKSTSLWEVDLNIKCWLAICISLQAAGLFLSHHTFREHDDGSAVAIAKDYIIDEGFDVGRSNGI